jgi:hypothetical protein
MVWGILLLPFVVRARRVSKRLRGIIVTLLLAASGSATLFTLGGCVSGNGFFGHQQSTYTVTVTATSGSLKRSTNLTLNVDLDIAVTHHLSLRAFEADWLRTQLPNADTNVQNNTRLAAGAVLRF